MNTVSEPNWEGFARAVMECWPHGDVEADVLEDLAKEFGLIRQVPGGFNPDEHTDDLCIAEKGDPWFEVTYTWKDPSSLTTYAEMALDEGAT